MERGSVRAIVMLVLILGMLFQQSTASFKSCFEECFIPCVIEPGQSVPSCTLKCLKHCTIGSSSVNHIDTKDFCKLGCAYSLCSNLSTKLNPGGDKVESCVDSCSETCTN